MIRRYWKSENQQMISPSEESSHRHGVCSVPGHWSVTRLKFVSDILSGATPSSGRPEYWGGKTAWITPDDLGRQHGRIVVETNRGITEEGYESCAATLGPPGSVAFSIRAPIGHIGILGISACVNQGCRILVPGTAIDGKFLYWVLWKSRSRLQRLGRGTTFMEVSRVDLADLPVALPPITEQKDIGQFLDHVDGFIQRYVRAKEKLIELLKEQKQAIIHQAVTGQIDVRTGEPYPAFKESGVEWLGEVPEHWEVSRLGRLVRLTVGFPFKSEGFTHSGEDIRLCRGVNIAPGGLRWDSVVRWPVEDLERFAEYRMEIGDIVLGMDRPVIKGGTRVAVMSASDVPSLLLQRVARIRVGEGLERDFAVTLLGGKGFSDYLAPIFTGISVPHLSPEQIKGFRFALPSVVEQRAIIEHVGATTGAVRSAIATTLAQIRLLTEYRTRLIADVVTGKLDVRRAAASLPEVDPVLSDGTAHKSEADMAKRPGGIGPAPHPPHP